jgi:hypothetical protein
VVNTEQFTRTDLTGSVGTSPAGTPTGGALALDFFDDAGVTILGSMPMSEFTMSYGLNTIATAAAVVPIGRHARTGVEAPIYGKLDQLKQMTPVKITMSGDLGEYNVSGTPWPTATAAKPHILFIGYVSGISYRRSLGRVSLVLNFVQKMFDLAQSSAGSGDVIPGSVQSLLQPTHVEGSGGGKIGMPGSRFVENLPTDMSIDFSDGLLKCLKYLAENSTLQLNEGWCTPAVAGLQALNDNTRALKCLEADAITGWKGIKNLGGPDPLYTTAYPLDIDAAQQQHVATAVGNTIFSSLGGTSMWSMMISTILPAFSMGFVTMSDRAFLVPILPMLKASLLSPTIYPEEYTDLVMTTLSQRPLYGVGVSSTFNNAVLNNAATSGNQQCVGGVFTASADVEQEGQWMFVTAPAWMDDWVSTPPKSKPPIVDILNTPSTTGTGEEPETPIPATDTDEVAEIYNGTYSKYAQMIYAANALRDRHGSVTGKLRFDICPGSTIMIEAKGEAASAGSVDKLPGILVGFVARVTVSMSAEKATASTTFELTHLRTFEEDQGSTDRFSMTNHPFFTEQFESAPLVESLVPPPPPGTQLPATGGPGGPVIV